MTESVYLVGAEEVTRAAGRISQAAEQMNRAALEISEALERDRRARDEQLARLEQILKDFKGTES